MEYFKDNTKVKDGSILLDIGCGNGIISLLLAKAYPKCHIHGIDIQENLLKQAKSNAKLNKLNNCTFERVDILKADLIEQYDHVLTNPPYHRIDKGFISTSNHKNVAHGMCLDDMQKWLETAQNLMAKNGTLTFIHHMQHLDDFKTLLKPYNHHIQPIKTNPNKPAKRVLVHVFSA